MPAMRKQRIQASIKFQLVQSAPTISSRLLQTVLLLTLILPVPATPIVQSSAILTSAQHLKSHSTSDDHHLAGKWAHQKVWQCNHSCYIKAMHSSSTTGVWNCTPWSIIFQIYTFLLHTMCLSCRQSKRIIIDYFMLTLLKFTHWWVLIIQCGLHLT